jgi:hypothetical protein
MSNVRVYWNLTQGCWSVMDKRTRRVIGHATQVLIREARFTVSEAGRQRVLRDRVKNVHAFVEGQLEAAIWSSTRDFVEAMPWELDRKGNNAYRAEANAKGTEVTYNPYNVGYFFDKTTFERVEAAPMAYLTWENRPGRSLAPKSRVLVFDPCLMGVAQAA